MGAVGPLSDKNQPVYPLCEAVRDLVVVESSFITVKQRDYFAIYLLYRITSSSLEFSVLNLLGAT